MKKVLGIGNALTDILLQIDDDLLLKQLNLPKGSMQLVDEKKQSEISNSFKHETPKMVAGGSASNTINGISRLGGKTGFIGKVGKDKIGSFYVSDSQHNGVEPHIYESETPSGCCLVLVSADGERTMCTFLGAAAELEGNELTPDLFTAYDIFHIEGYLVQNHNLIRKAMQLAKKAGLQVSIDLASYNVVDENIDFLNEIISNYVDIVFANEEEARSFTGKEPLEALNKLAEQVSIAVVKVGKDGSHIKSGNDIYHIEARESNCVDSTGAGDLYAAGFLYGLACNYSLDVCGKIGSLVAGNIVEIVGAKMDNEVWDLIHQEMKQITSSVLNKVNLL